MAKLKVNSKILSVLEQLGVEYTIKNSNAFLKEWDSLSINLTGDYAGFWTRWSRNIHGRNHIDLVTYMVKEGLVKESDAKRVLGSEIPDHIVQIKEATPYNFKEMVTNPQTFPIKEWLVKIRKLNPVLVQRFIDLGLIVRDGRDNIRFLWTSASGEVVGADVQGIIRDEEKFGKRGTLKLILPGSNGFFNVKSKDVNNYSEVENVYITEAPIDLISLIELGAVSDSDRDKSSFELPRLKGKSLYIALSGASSKLDVVLKRLQSDFQINPQMLKSIVVATDNDNAGKEVFSSLKKSGYKNLESLIPNDDQHTLINGVVSKIKDWNELLKLYKEECSDSE